MQVKRDITGGIMSLGVIVTSIFAIMHSNLTEVNMNEVTIVENGERNTITTEAETVLELMTDGEVQFGNFDELDVEIDDVVYDGMEIEITRANPVIINDGGTRFHTMVTESDVFEVLDKHNIELGDDDLLEIVKTNTNALGEEIQINPTAVTSFAGSIVEIEVTRVHFEVESNFEEITLETEYIYTDDLLEGEREVQVEGSPRTYETIIESEFRNGEFYEIVSEETNVVDEGVSRVVAIGTYVPAPPPPAAPTNAGNAKTTTPDTGGDLESFTANVTAFLATCPGCTGITANGTDVRTTTTFSDSTFGTVRIIAADRKFPFGTIINVSGVGNAIVLDRGGSVTGNVLDLLMGANDNPLQFGRQFLQAQVVRLGW
jgi:uncharacterized protein YabE (DUF348 family)/3D (Asp-Asp-Asp) domain-containing protein